MNIYENYFREVIRMLVGYMRVSTQEQTTSLQKDALLKYGVDERNIFADVVSGASKNREGLNHALEFLKSGDTLVVWKLDRLGRNLKHLINTIDDLNKRNIGFKVLSGQGVNIDTTTSAGKMMFSIFGAFAEFERDLIRERTMAGLQAARARGRKGGRKFNLTKSQVRLAEASMKNRDTSVKELCAELGITRPTLYKYIGPNGELRDFAKRVLEITN